MRGGTHVEVDPICQEGDHLADGFGIEYRLIALEIYDDVDVESRGNRCYSVRTSIEWLCNRDSPPERAHRVSDTIVVCCYNSVRNPSDLARATPHPFDEGVPRDLHERFARETG
jgi:hypothetical protein